MPSNPTIKPTMGKNISSDASPGTTAHHYRPSVPISVYRELANELHTAQTMVNSLKVQNQELTEQNQQLRQEFENVVHSAMQLQQAIASFQQLGGHTVLDTHSQAEIAIFSGTNPVETVEHPHGEVIQTRDRTESLTPEISENLKAEEESPNRAVAKPERKSKAKSLWLAITILAIMLGAFGAGYWVVRPILSNPRTNPSLQR